MATINIKTQNDNTIKAIKALLLLDPTATIVCDEPMLSESDQKKARRDNRSIGQRRIEAL